MVRRGMPPNLTEVMESLLREVVGKAQLSRDKAIQALERGDHAAAVRHYEQVARDEPDLMEKARTYMIIGHLRLILRQPRQAEQALRESQDLIQSIPEGLGIERLEDWLPSAVAIQQGFEQHDANLAAAEEAYQVTINLGHTRFALRAANNLGTLEYNSRGRPDRARELWESAFADSDWRTHGLAAYNLGWYWENIGERKKARKYYWIAARNRLRPRQTQEDRQASQRAIRRLILLGRR